jgi:hypothetical protein
MTWRRIKVDDIYMNINAAFLRINLCIVFSTHPYGFSHCGSYDLAAGGPFREAQLTAYCKE